MHYFTNRRGRLTTIMKSLNSSSSVMLPRILVFASLILPFFVCMALAEVHYYDFIVKEVNFTRLCQNKLMLVVNESYPGPAIRARKGDTIYVNVYNQGFYGFTIHWHGVKQPRNPWFDGPEYVTQCPIAPGTNFTYQVQLSKEEGTVWWHAHSDWTRASVHGAIVVLPALGTMFPFPEPDEEEIIVFGSWYLGNLRERVEESLQPGSTETLPQSDAYTINGQPGDFLPCSINATWRRKVDHGKTYLLRLVNANIDAEFFFAIAEHNLTVVGLDGAYTKPINSRYIVVTPGQTMDVLLYANSTPGLYYMAGRQYLSTTSDTGFDHMNATAILQYNGNYTTTDAPLFPEHLPMYMSQAEAFNFTNQIRSLASPEHPVNVPKESEITTRMFITASMNSLYCAPDLGPTCVNISFATSVNNISWVNPTTDSILQAYYRNISNPIYETDFPDQAPTYFNFTDGGTTMSTVLTVQGTKVKVLDYNETVEIVFQGTNVMGGAVNHPMHLHGHSFYVLGFGFGPFDPVKDPKGYNLVDPPYVATFVTPKNGWLTIRFVADNPGVWFWHCHVERHMTWGMEAAFIIKDGGTAETSMLPPPAQMPSCDVPLDSAIRNYEALIEKQME